MPPSTRSTFAPPTVQPPPSRIYESTTPLAQAKLPAIRQRVYGRHSLGAPLTKKRQGTLTQIGFVNPEKIDDEIAEYEKEMERGKRRKTEGGTPLRRVLRAKPVVAMRDTPVSGTRLRQMMDKEEVDVEAEKVVPAQLKQQESVQRLDDTPEPEAGEGRPKKKRKSRKGITIGVKTVIIKVESPEVQRTQYTTQNNVQDDNEETQGTANINMVMDSFQAAPSFEEERNHESYVQMQAEQEKEAEIRRNRVIPDSDAESEDESIVYDSNDEERHREVEAAPHKDLDEYAATGAEHGGSDVDLDEVKDSVENKADSEQGLDDLSDAELEARTEMDLDLTREIPDSQAESEDDEDLNLYTHESLPPPPRPVLKQEDTLILNSFSVPSCGSPAIEARLRTKSGPDTVPDSFSVPGSPTASTSEQQLAIIKDSFYPKPPTLQQDSSFERLVPPAPSPIAEEEVDFVPSSSAVSVPEPPPAPDIQETVAVMPPPPVTPRKPRHTEIPNTGSTCSGLSTQSTIRSMTPNSVRSKRYNQSPTKAYNRSPLNRLTEKNVLNQSLDLPRLDLSPSKKAGSSLQLRESQISTQGTPTQRSRASQVLLFVKPEPQTNADLYDDEETTIIPQSPTLIKPERNDTQNTTDTNSPSRQIHSELSAARHSDQSFQPLSLGRTIRFLKTEVKDSQAESEDEEFDDDEYRHYIEKPEAESDDEIYDDGEYHNSIQEELYDRGKSMKIQVEGDRVQVVSSPKMVTPRVVRFQSISADIPAQLQFHSSPMVQASGSDPAMGSEGTQASSMSRPSIVGAETQMRSQWLSSDNLSSGHGGETQGTVGGGTMGDSQWLGDLLPESLMGLGEEGLSVPPIMDDDSVWDEFRGSRRSGVDEIED